MNPSNPPFRYTSSPIWLALIDDLGSAIERQQPLADVRQRGVFSSAKIVRAALHVITTNLSAGEVVSETALRRYREAYDQHSAYWKDGHQTTLRLSAQTRGELDWLRDWVSGNPMAADALTLIPARPTGSVPDTLLMFVAVSYALDHLKTAR